MSSWARLRSWTLARQRWFAGWSVFSLFSLFTLIDGDTAWLSCLAFLGFLVFLAPQNGTQPAEPTRGQSDHTGQ